jgi:hypothetical protein
LKLVLKLCGQHTIDFDGNHLLSAIQQMPGKRALARPDLDNQRFPVGASRPRDPFENGRAVQEMLAELRTNHEDRTA